MQQLLAERVQQQAHQQQAGGPSSGLSFTPGSSKSHNASPTRAKSAHGAPGPTPVPPPASSASGSNASSALPSPQVGRGLGGPGGTAARTRDASFSGVHPGGEGHGGVFSVANPWGAEARPPADELLPSAGGAMSRAASRRHAAPTLGDGGGSALVAAGSRRISLASDYGDGTAGGTPALLPSKSMTGAGFGGGGALRPSISGAVANGAGGGGTAVARALRSFRAQGGDSFSSPVGSPGVVTSHATPFLLELGAADGDAPLSRVASTAALPQGRGSFSGTPSTFRSPASLSGAAAGPRCSLPGGFGPTSALSNGGGPAGSGPPSRVRASLAPAGVAAALDAAAAAAAGAAAFAEAPEARGSFSGGGGGAECALLAIAGAPRPPASLGSPGSFTRARASFSGAAPDVLAMRKSLGGGLSTSSLSRGSFSGAQQPATVAGGGGDNAGDELLAPAPQPVWRVSLHHRAAADPTSGGSAGGGGGRASPLPEGSKSFTARGTAPPYSDGSLSPTRTASYSGAAPVTSPSALSGKPVDHSRLFALLERPASRLSSSSNSLQAPRELFSSPDLASGRGGGGAEDEAAGELDVAPIRSAKSAAYGRLSKSSGGLGGAGAGNVDGAGVSGGDVSGGEEPAPPRRAAPRCPSRVQFASLPGRRDGEDDDEDEDDGDAGF